MLKGLWKEGTHQNRIQNLVGGLEHVFCLYIGIFIIPTGTWILFVYILGISSSQLTFTPSFFRGVLNHQPDMDECVRFRTCRWDPNMLLQVRNFNHSSSKQKGIAFFHIGGYIYWFSWWLCGKSLVGSNVWLFARKGWSFTGVSQYIRGSSMRTDWLKIILLWMCCPSNVIGISM